MSKYQTARTTRREIRTLADSFKGGKLAPVMAQPFYGSESGVINQSVHYKLDPVPGRMITACTAEIIAVYVPAQAIDALKNPTDDIPGSADALRQKLLSGAALFGMETEGEISKRSGVVPRSISGVKKVNEMVRLGHNCAVNYLRQRKYVNAAQLDKTSTAVTPALISQTVLDRLNGVLDPEDRVNGAVNLSGEIPVTGLGIKSNQSFSTSSETVKETGGTGTELYVGNKATSNSGQFYVEEDPNNSGYPNLKINLGASNQGINLQDFYEAQKMDELTRMMRKMVDQNPEYGEEMVARFAHGLSVDPGKTPFLLYQSQKVFGQQLDRATDGASLGDMSTNLVQSIDFTVPVPATEFGGIVITFACVKPDEALASQPHPILSEEWGAINYVADEMAFDPVAVTVRDLNADCSSGDEGTIALYVGNNHLKKTYVNYGFTRNVDPQTVDSETSIWQLEVPMSVTPENVIYPENLGQEPFADSTAEICNYTINSMVQVNTPLIFGPTPIEELATIDTDDIFEDA